MAEKSILPQTIIYFYLLLTFKLHSNLWFTYSVPKDSKTWNREMDSKWVRETKRDGCREREKEHDWNKSFTLNITRIGRIINEIVWSGRSVVNQVGLHVFACSQAWQTVIPLYINTAGYNSIYARALYRNWIHLR